MEYWGGSSEGCWFKHKTASSVFEQSQGNSTEEPLPHHEGLQYGPNPDVPSWRDLDPFWDLDPHWWFWATLVVSLTGGERFGP